MARFTHMAFSLLTLHTLTAATGCALVVEPRYLRAVPEAGTTEGMDVVFGSDAVRPDGRVTDDVPTVESDVVVTFDVPTERTDVTTSFDVPTRADVPTARDVPTVRPDVPNGRPDTYVDAPNPPNPCAVGEMRCLDMCVNTQRSPLHCGGCSSVCSAGPNQGASCSGGICSRVCMAGFGDCDGVLANGCETNTNTSLPHCGRCNSGCAIPGGGNNVASCNLGQCRFTCVPGFADCDRVDLNGCEIELASDPRNCGACGNVCGANLPACINGSCRGCRAGQVFCPGPIGGQPVCCLPVGGVFDCMNPMGAVCVSPG